MNYRTQLTWIAALAVLTSLSCSAWADDATCPSPKAEQLTHGHADTYYEVTGDKKKDAEAYSAAVKAGNAQANKECSEAAVSCPRSATGFQCTATDLKCILSAPQPQVDAGGDHYVYVGWRRMGLCVMPKEGMINRGSSTLTMPGGAKSETLQIPSEKTQPPGANKNPEPLTIPK